MNLPPIYFDPITQLGNGIIEQMIGYSLVILKRDLTDSFIASIPNRPRQKLLQKLKTDERFSADRLDEYVHRQSRTSSFPIEAVPSSITDMIHLYFVQPIGEPDRIQFINEYPLPFHQTGKSLKELYALYPDTFRPVLDLCIKSKRYQRINYIIDRVLDSPFGLFPLKTILMPAHLEEFSRARLSDEQTKRLETETEVEIAEAMFVFQDTLKEKASVPGGSRTRKNRRRKRVHRSRRQ